MLSLPEILLYLKLVISKKTHLSAPTQKKPEAIVKLAFVKEVWYCRTANPRKRTVIDDKSDAVHR